MPALVVSQTAQVHLEIEQYLAALREFRAEHPHDPAEDSTQRPGEDELVVFAYHIPGNFGWETQKVPAETDKSSEKTETRAIEPTLAVRKRIAQEWAKALPKLIAQETWGADGGSIQVVSDVLYIRQPHGRARANRQVAFSPAGGEWGRSCVPR